MYDSIALAALMGLSLIASIAKITIPVAGTDSSLTVCHVVDFITRIVCGPSVALIVSAFGGWAQRTLRSPTTFRSIVSSSGGALALTMETAGWVYQWLGGQPGLWSQRPQFEPLISAATVVFLLNSILVAGAVALTTRRSTPLVWFESYSPTRPADVHDRRRARFGDRRGSRTPRLLALAVARRAAGVAAPQFPFIPGKCPPLGDRPAHRACRISATWLLTWSERLRPRDNNRRQFAVIFVDLDGLKTMNDRAGHQIRDAVLVRVADCLRKNLRVHDVCARCGGDEFVIVLSDCGSAEAKLRRDELQRAVRAIAIDLEPGFRTSLNISAGVSVYPDDGDTQENCLRLLTARMYEDKFRWPSEVYRLTA